MYGYIYITENLINGKKYIGQHTSNSFDPKYFGSGKLLNLAIEKYGKENFKITILKECNSVEELDEWEHHYIEKFNAVESDMYYNMIPGGGVKHASFIAKETCSKPVICIEKKTLYPSLAFLEKNFGFNHGNLSMAIKKGISLYGYHWKYVSKDDYKKYLKLYTEDDMKNDFEKYVFDNHGEKNPMYNKEVPESTVRLIKDMVSKAWKSGKYNSKKVPVRCISLSDGKILEFESGMEAGRYLEKKCNIKAAYNANIYKACREGRIAYGHKWELVDVG